MEKKVTEKQFPIGKETKLVETIMSDFEIDRIVNDVSAMKVGDCTGYMQYCAWEVRKGVRFYESDIKPSGYQITEAEALYCDIVKKDNKYELYISEAGKTFNKEPFLSTDTLDEKELKQHIINLIDDARKDIYRQYYIDVKKEESIANAVVVNLQSDNTEKKNMIKPSGR